MEPADRPRGYQPATTLRQPNRTQQSAQAPFASGVVIKRLSSRGCLRSGPEEGSDLSTYRTIAMTALRALALIGILPGAIVAAAYLLVLAGQLYQHWDVRTAIVVGMAAWGVVGVF